MVRRDVKIGVLLVLAAFIVPLSIEATKSVITYIQLNGEVSVEKASSEERKPIPYPDRPKFPAANGIKKDTKPIVVHDDVVLPDGSKGIGLSKYDWWRLEQFIMDLRSEGGAYRQKYEDAKRELERCRGVMKKFVKNSEGPESPWVES